MARPRLAVTVDVERMHKTDFPGLVEWLELLDHFGVKATFFVTGDVLRNFESHVRGVVAAGHEIASHGTNHPSISTPGFHDRLLPSLKDHQLEEEIRRSREEFEEKGIPVTGFRAVAHQADARVLAAIGRHFAYDSSMVKRSGPYRLAGSTLEIP